MRIPSSFHSTDARSKPATASADVSRGRGEHRQDRPEELEADRAQTLLALASIAISAVRVRSPESINARRASVAGHARRLRHRVGHQPGERALPQLAGEAAA